MKRKSVSELRLIQWLAVFVVLVIAVPIAWKMVAIDRAAVQSASDDRDRILSTVSAGRLDQAWQWSTDYLKNERADAASLKELGSAFLVAGRPSAAFLLFDAAAAKGTDGATDALLAQACLSEGHSFEAASYADRAVGLGAGGPEGYDLLGDCLAAAGQYADAITAYSKVLDGYPFDVPALQGKAAAFQAIERYGQAHAIWDTLIQSLSSDTTEDGKKTLLHAELQRAYSIEGEGRPEEILTAWTDLLTTAMAVGDVELRSESLSGLARHALSTGDPSSAVVLYREAIPLSTGSRRTYERLLLAKCLQGMGDAAAARQEVAALVAETPSAVATIFSDEDFTPLRAFFF